MPEQDVVITGLGLVSPLGKNVAESWSSIREMKTGIVREQRDDLPEFMQHLGRVPEYDLPGDIPPKQTGQMKFLNRGALLGFCAAAEALASSRESIQQGEPGRRALYIASGDHTKIGYQFMHPAIQDSTDETWSSLNYPKLNEAGLNKVNPFFLLESLNNNLFSFLSAYGEFMGPNTSLASLSPCGGNALELACRSIRQNRADIALAVGYGSWINDLSLYELDGLGILSRCRYGAESYKPFDRRRDGFIPGEGGAAILLASSSAAGKRGSTALGTIMDCANSVEFSSNQPFSVPGKVSRQSMLSVLAGSGSAIGELAFIIPHGSGTQKGDRSELNSLADVFTVQGTDAPVCGLKPYTGHMGAASDLAEIIMGIHAVKENIVPATLNFREAEKPFAHLKISASPRECHKNRFLSTSYGAGGQSSSVLVEVY